jgi:hypothetical protein
MNLFAKAVKSAPTTKKAKDEKFRISINDSDFFDKVKNLQDYNNQLSSIKAKADMISGELKDIGREKWAELYQEMGKNPGTVMLEQISDEDDVAQLMFITQDKYITINEERANELKESYGEEIIEQDTTYSFDNAMIEKYGEVLSKLIMESDEIKESDKVKIIKATTKFSIKKGTIDNLNDYGDVSVLMEEVRPVVAIKNVEVING